MFLTILKYFNLTFESITNQLGSHTTMQTRKVVNRIYLLKVIQYTINNFRQNADNVLFGELSRNRKNIKIRDYNEYLSMTVIFFVAISCINREWLSRDAMNNYLLLMI